jgi:hypothetical protein
MIKQLNMPDLKANPHQIESGDWVAMGNKLGRVLEPVKSHICEFWITWSGEKLPINYLAGKLIKVDYSGKDLAGTKLPHNRYIKKMVWESQILLEVVSSDEESTFLALDQLNILTSKVLPLSSILIDEELQSRVELHQQTLEEYTEAYAQGVEFPPVIVFHDGEQYFLSDGFHRVKAAIAAGLTEIPVEVKHGTKRDAILYSVGANAKHGLRRTNADKRRAVMTLLGDSEWKQWSDREIARQCGVGNKFVGDVRRSLCSEHSENSNERIYKTKHGTVGEMKIANIGKSKLSESLPIKEEEEHINQNTKNNTSKMPRKSHKEKKEILIKEGLNYKAGNPGMGCHWYVEVQEETYQKLKEYQQKINTATVDSAIKRFLETEEEKPINSDDICVALTSNIQQLTKDRLELVANAIASNHPEIICQIAEKLKSSIFQNLVK